MAFWDFIGARTRSENYQRYLAQGMTRSLVAMRAEDSSTRTVGRILLQLFYGILVPGGIFDRLLDRAHQRRLDRPVATAHDRAPWGGVAPDATLRSLNLAGDRLRSVTVERDGRLEEVTADFYVAAVPLEVMQGLVTPELARAAPSLSRLGELRTEWMNGIQFYLHTDLPLAARPYVYLDSNWALTSVSQRQFWSGFDLSQYGNGQVGGILSVDISNWIGARATSTAGRRRQPRRATRSRTKCGRS